MSLYHLDRLLIPTALLTEDEWWGLAIKNPWPCMQHAFFGLLTLTDPERWIGLEQRQAHHWIDAELGGLPESAQQAWASDCLDRLWPLLEGPGVTSLDHYRLCRAARRAFAEGRYSKDQWLEVREGAKFYLIREEKMTGNSVYSLDAIFAVDPRICAKSACQALCPKDYRSSSASTEEIWQWRRLVHYLKEQLP